GRETPRETGTHAGLSTSSVARSQEIKGKATPGQSPSAPPWLQCRAGSALRVPVRLPALRAGTSLSRSSAARSSCARPFGLILQPPADWQGPHQAAILAAARLRRRSIAEQSNRASEDSPRATPRVRAEQHSQPREQGAIVRAHGCASSRRPADDE